MDNGQRLFVVPAKTAYQLSLPQAESQITLARAHIRHTGSEPTAYTRA